MTCGKFTMLAIVLLSIAPQQLRADDSQAYPILLDRPSHKGDKHPLEIVHARVITNTTTWQGHDPTTKEDSVGARLLCDAEIRAVDENGNVTEAEYIIRKCTKLKDDRELDLFAAGTTLVARVKGQTTELVVDGKAVAKDTQEVVGSFISLARSPDIATYDKIFGSSRSRKIGESWPIDSGVGSVAMKHYGWEVDPKDFLGNVTLKRVEDVDGEPCLRVEANTQMKHFKPTNEAVGEMTLKDAVMDARTVWAAPINLKKDVPSVVSEVTYTYTWTGERKGLTYEIVQTDRSETHARIAKE